MKIIWILWWIVNAFWLFILGGFSVAIINSYNLSDGVVESVPQAILFFVILLALMIIPIAGQFGWYKVIKRSEAKRAAYKNKENANPEE